MIHDTYVTYVVLQSWRLENIRMGVKLGSELAFVYGPLLEGSSLFAIRSKDESCS